MSAASIESLRKAVLEEARRKAEEILSNARAEAERIIREAEEEWRRRVEEERRRIIRDAQARAQVIISEAEREARLIVSRKKKEIVDRVFDEAWERIRRGIGYSREESLRNLLKEAASYIPPSAEHVKIIVSGRDVETARRLAGEIIRISHSVEPSDQITGGVLIEGSDGTVVDNTYDNRFKRSRESLVSDVARLLWGKQGP